jgi:hypothetical protein
MVLRGAVRYAAAIRRSRRRLYPNLHTYGQFTLPVGSLILHTNQGFASPSQRMLLSFLPPMLDGICALSELPCCRPSEPIALQMSPPDALLETYTGQVLGTMVKYAIQCHSLDGSTNLMSKSRMIWASSLARDIRTCRVWPETQERQRKLPCGVPFSSCAYRRADFGQLHTGYMLTRTAHPPGAELDLS